MNARTTPLRRAYARRDFVFLSAGRRRDFELYEVRKGATIKGIAWTESCTRYEARAAANFVIR